MNILAIDPATTTGYCREGASGTWNYRNGTRVMELPHRLSLFKRDLELALEIMEMKGGGAADAIVHEVAHHRGGPATRSAMGMETVILMVAYERNIPVFGVHSLTLKKFATGNGHAEKEDMIKAAREACGYQPKDDNEADAIHLYNWGRKFISRNKLGVPVSTWVSLTSHQKKSAKKRQRKTTKKES